MNSDELFDALATAVWQSWVPLGLAASARSNERRPLDPEALVVMSFALGRDEPRLRDESLDWLCANGELLSLSRLRNVRRRLDLDEDLFETYVHWVSQHGGPRWSARAAMNVAPIPRRRSNKSVPPDLGHPSALALRLRRVCGVGIHAEVLRVLLSTGPNGLTIGEIRDHVAYSSRSVIDVMGGLDATGLLLRRTENGRRKYMLDRQTWVGVAGSPAIETIDTPWVTLYGDALRILRLKRPGKLVTRYVERSRALTLATEFVQEGRYVALARPEPGNAEDIVDQVATVVLSEIVPR